MSVLSIEELSLDYRHQLRIDATEADRKAADEIADGIRQRWSYGWRPAKREYNEYVKQYVDGKPTGETKKFTERYY